MSDHELPSGEIVRSVRRAISNVPESYGGFGLVRRVEVDDAIVVALQGIRTALAAEGAPMTTRDAEIAEAVLMLDWQHQQAHLAGRDCVSRAAVLALLKPDPEGTSE